MKVTAKLADTLAKRIQPSGASWEEMRDHISIVTGDEFDCTQLDLLTDMVMKRHEKKGQANV